MQRTGRTELHRRSPTLLRRVAAPKPVNALAPMLRAPDVCAALSINFFGRMTAVRTARVTLQPGPRSPFEAEIALHCQVRCCGGVRCQREPPTCGRPARSIGGPGIRGTCRSARA